MYSQPGDEVDWMNLPIRMEKEGIPPTERFGKYLYSNASRAVLRETSEGRAALLEIGNADHERHSDVAPFTAWDGEGITYEEGMPQQYVLFGDSRGNSIQSHSLPTSECLALIIESEKQQPSTIHVGFSFKYDAEMILRDLRFRKWRELRATGETRFGPYRIAYHPGKMFQVSRKMDGKMYSATIYDIWGFFQASFVKALKTWLDDSELETIRKIEEGKLHRGDFTEIEIDSLIKPYWQEELRLLVILAERLRERLLAADVCPSQWHGAGALATTLYRQYDIRSHIARTERDYHPRDKRVAEIPEAVNVAAQHAYAGGRFELFRMGHHNGTVYQYDINSAYPDGISRLPSLSNAEWEYVENPEKIEDFGVYHVCYERFHPTIAQPLPYRDMYGRVSFPSFVDGWYWSPEAEIGQTLGGTVTEGWVLHHDNSYPFAWVRDLYDERKRRKAMGDPSQMAYKLGLNSLYGKMAQRVGWTLDSPLPRFHQLEWAGWVTSWTRAKIFHACIYSGNNLIACETDAVFTMAPIVDIDCGPELGQWEYTEHDWITYLQSGTYWSNHGSKYRGFDSGSISHDAAMQWLRDCNFTAPLIGRTTRFVGAGTGLGTPLHRCWVTDSRDLQPGRSGKRVHIPEACDGCRSGTDPTNTMHPLHNVVEGGRTYPHSLPWLDGEPEDAWQDMYDMNGWDEIA